METTALPLDHEIEEQNQDLPLAEIQSKSHYTGKIVKTSLAGAIVDIGLDKPGVIHISQLQKDPVNRVEDVVQVGQSVDVWVRRVFPKKGRIELTMIKPLDMDWRDLEEEMVVKGTVTRLEKFGAFVEIGAERPGLIHISEMAHGYVKDPSEILHEGDEVEVKILKVNRRKKQIKLSMKALAPAPEPVAKTEPGEREERRERSPRGERGDRGDRGERRDNRGTRSASKPVDLVVEDEVQVPTAMEIALREAMERSKKETDEEEAKTKRKAAPGNQELEAILTRTLQNKVRTAK
jgi:small subunit ribosomal protein S1